MRLDPKLIRLILLDVEGAEDVKDELASYTEEQYRYHADQLIDAGLAKGTQTFVQTGLADLTFEGHQVLANLRNDKAWKRTLESLAKSGGSASLDILTTVAAQFTAEFLKKTIS